MEKKQKTWTVLTLLSFLIFYLSKVRNYSHSVTEKWHLRSAFQSFFYQTRRTFCVGHPCLGFSSGQSFNLWLGRGSEAHVQKFLGDRLRRVVCTLEGRIRIHNHPAKPKQTLEPWGWNSIKTSAMNNNVCGGNLKHNNTNGRITGGTAVQ